MARDGGVFTYGEPTFDGSAGSLVLDAPIAGMAATGDGGGYWLVAATAGSSPTAMPATSARSAGRPCPGPWWAWPRRPAGTGYFLAVGSEALAGKVVGIDPGHNGLNYSAPGIIDAPVFNGTGPSVRHDGDGDRQRLHRGAIQLQRGHVPGGRSPGPGATVVLTRPNNAGVGPCVTTGPPSSTTPTPTGGRHPRRRRTAEGRGFAMLEPMADGPNNGVIASSAAFAATSATPSWPARRYR